jgi:hypothetical protein
MGPISHYVQRPEGSPPQGTSQCVDAPFVPDEPEQGGDSEVTGRDLRSVGGRLIYPSYWHSGLYISITDGDVYRGPHWHPNPRSPIAYTGTDEPPGCHS